MPSRQTFATQWLFTDEKLGAEVWGAIGRVPRGGGVVLRHHHSEPHYGARVAAACRDHGLMLAVAGDAGFAHALGAGIVHNPAGDVTGLLVSRSVHSAAEARAAQGAALIFVSPVFVTASHPGHAALGLAEAVRLSNIAGGQGIALGGMNAARGPEAIAAGLHGWAAIDAWR